MSTEHRTTDEKALQINVDASRYGTFAEIGAGQEVARWFFHAGGAAGTVAKTMSAYDMSVSDAIYGSCSRYVSRQRLLSMFDHEFGLMEERLAAKRGDKTAFFVYANTMAARSYTRHEEGNGWMGVRFQHMPQSAPSEIILHVRMLDSENVREQEAIGVLGVNLLHGAFYHRESPPALIASLLDGLTHDRIEIDMIRFSGPGFAGWDNRLMSLQLVEQGFTEAVMFTADGEVVQPLDMLYKKPILIERGSFRPVTNLTQAILEHAAKRFPEGEPPVTIMEMTLRQLQMGDRINHSDFLARVDILAALGHTVMISNYLRHHRLIPFLRRMTPKHIGFAMGLRNLKELFDQQFYTDMPGGILQALGQLFQGDLKLYVCPAIDTKTDLTISPEDYQVAPNLRHLYAHLLENNLVEAINGFDKTLLRTYSREIIANIQCGNPAWEKAVPPLAVELIKRNKFFDYKPAPMNLTKQLRLKPGHKVRLAKWDADDTAGVHKEDADKLLKKNIERLAALEYRLYAESKRSVLIVLQGMDAAGKDGTIRHVMSGLNPQSCRVTSFKVPSAEEQSHDFLWRIHKAVPAHGEIGIFNRSLYEDVLVVRVHKLVPKEVWSERYDQINDFEKMLTANNVTILKFFLHISRDEQRERLQARLDDPTKSWKLTPADVAERKLWKEYQQAYEDALSRCGTEAAPWFIIPANKKWFRNLAVSQIVVEAMESLDLKFPKPVADLSKIVIK